MGTLTLRRTYYPDCTEGQLFLDGRQVAVTMELPWLDNEQEKSCIPEATYNFVPHNSPDHPNTWEIIGVPGRTGILIHNGNVAATQSLGCILVGDTYGVLDGQKAVLNSVVTLEELRTILPDSGQITISEKTSTPEETLPWSTPAA